MTETAFKRGYDAFYDGYGLSDNPYYGDIANFDLYEEWIEGYKEAQFKFDSEALEGSCYD